MKLDSDSGGFQGALLKCNPEYLINWSIFSALECTLILIYNQSK